MQSLYSYKKKLPPKDFHAQRTLILIQPGIYLFTSADL